MRVELAQPLMFLTVELRFMTRVAHLLQGPPSCHTKHRGQKREVYLLLLLAIWNYGFASKAKKGHATDLV